MSYPSPQGSGMFVEKGSERLYGSQSVDIINKTVIARPDSTIRDMDLQQQDLHAQGLRKINQPASHKAHRRIMDSP